MTPASALLTQLIPNWEQQLSEIRQIALLELADAIGPKLANYQRFLFEIQHSDFESAALTLQDSRWYGLHDQLGERIVHMIRKNEAF